MVRYMTLNTITKKLLRNNLNQYALFMGSIIFAVAMIGGYGILQFSPTISNVLMDGGSTQKIALSMFGFTLIGTFAFVLYAHSLFLKHKSKEIGVFISLGIKRNNVRKMVMKELNIIFLIATLIGLLLSIVIAWLSWTVLTLYLSTSETNFTIGWKGFEIALIFAILVMLIARLLTASYIKKVDIIKILKANDEIEEIKGDNFILGLIGAVMIPTGIILYTSGFAPYFLIASLVGLYLLIVQITSIGALIKKINPTYYYKNIILFNMIKLKGKQYTLSLFVSTILIGVSIFGVAFSAAPMISGMMEILYSHPYDYIVKVGFQQEDFTQNNIEELAIEYNVKLKDFKTFDTIRMAQLLKRYNQWSPMNIVSEETVCKLTGKTFNVEPGSFAYVISAAKNSDSNKYFSQPQEPITLLNPTTKEEFTLNFKGIQFIDHIMNPDTQFFLGDFYVVDSDLYNKLYKEQNKEYIFTTYVFNTQNWKQTEDFSTAMSDSITKSSGGKWCPNYNDGVIFDRVRAQCPGVAVNYEYMEIKSSSLEANRWWVFTPYSRYHKANNSISDFAIYILLMLYISVIAFVSAIMTIGIKILNTVWQDKGVYKNITFLGARKKEIKSLVSKQVAFIYYVPTALGTMITLFLFRSMLYNMMVLEYKNIAFLFTCGLSLLVILIQVGLFFVIRRHAIKECMDSVITNS